jgi:FtsZ-binding cell division protein ZapB
MPTIITLAEIADMIGVEDAIIRRTLDRRDDDLQPYLHEDPEDKGQNEGETDSPVSEPPTPLLDLEGLPLLITKLAFNIPTLDIIENLACQVLHLTVLREENTDLTIKNQELQDQNEQLQDRINDLQHQVAELQRELTRQAEIQSRSWVHKFFRRRKSERS